MVLRSFLMLLAALLLGGCEAKPERPVIVGTNIWVGYEPGYVAKKHDLYGDADISLRQFRSATEVLRAFRNQAIDVAALTLDEALTLHQSGVPIRIFLVTNISNGADAIMAQPSIASVRALEGKKIGLEDSALGAYMFARAMQLNGVDAKRVTQVSITVDETVQHYRTNQVDAVVTFEPFKSELKALGAREIFDSRQIPNEIVDVLVVREAFAKANPVVLKSLAKGWLAGAALVKTGDPSALKEVGERLGMRPAELKVALAQVKIPTGAEHGALLEGPVNPLAQAARKLIPLLEQRSGTSFSFEPQDIITSEFLEVRVP